MKVTTKDVVLLVSISMLLLTGCSETVGHFFNSDLHRDVRGGSINLEDGVDADEAVIIAQKMLLNSGHRNDYDDLKPRPNPDELAPDCWRVTFAPKRSGYDSCGYKVLVNKVTGEAKDGCYHGL